MNRSLPRLHVLAAGASIPLGILALLLGAVEVVAGVAAVALEISSSSVIALASQPASVLLVAELLLRPLYEIGMNAWRTTAGLGVLGRRSWGRKALVGWANVRVLQSLLFVVIEARWIFAGPQPVLPLLTTAFVMAILLDVVPVWVLWCMSGGRRGTASPPVDAAAATRIFGRSSSVVSVEDAAWFIGWGQSLFRLQLAVVVVAATIANLAVVAAINAPGLVMLANVIEHLATA